MALHDESTKKVVTKADLIEVLDLVEAAVLLCTNGATVTLPTKRDKGPLPDWALSTLARLLEPVKVTIRRDVVRVREPWSPPGSTETLNVLVFERAR